MGWQFEIFQISATGWGWKLRRPNGKLFCFSDEQHSDPVKVEASIADFRLVAPRTKKIVYIDSPGEVKKRGGDRFRKSATTPKPTAKQEKKPAKKK